MKLGVCAILVLNVLHDILTYSFPEHHVQPDRRALDRVRAMFDSPEASLI
jgi:hypothetical protein